MIDKLFALPAREHITSAISVRQQDQLEIIIVDHPQVKASIALQGAHLLSWQPKGEQQVLWLSDKTAFHKGTPLRGGVPVCWPWFGPAEDPALPAHGFARNLPWSLKAHHEDEQGVVLTFELKSDARTLELWPHEFTLYARFKLAARCEIELEAHGEFEITAALHSYFTVGDIAQVSVSGLGETYLDKVLGGTQGQLASGVQDFPDRTDRVYLNPEACSVIHDAQMKRAIHITHHHNQNVVAWNPGPALSVSMSDLPDEGYKHFVCVETACVTGPQKVTAERPCRLSQIIDICRKA